MAAPRVPDVAITTAGATAGPRAERRVTGAVRSGWSGPAGSPRSATCPARRPPATCVLAAVAEPDPVRRTASPPARHRLPAFPDGERSSPAPMSRPWSWPLRPPRTSPTHARRGRRVGAPVEKPPAPDGRGRGARGPRARALRRVQPALRPRPRGAARVHASRGRVAVVAQLPYRRGGWGAHDVRDDAVLDLGPHVVDLARAQRKPRSRRRRAECRPRAGPTFDLALERGRARSVATEWLPRARRGPAPRRHGGSGGTASAVR